MTKETMKRKKKPITGYENAIFMDLFRRELEFLSGIMMHRIHNLPRKASLTIVTFVMYDI